MPRKIGLLLTAALVIGLAAPVFAQEGGKAVPAVELAGGYGFVRDFDLEENIPAGWYFSTAGNLTRWLAVVGELAGSHKTEDVGSGASASVTLLTGMGGPRFFHKAGRFIPYGQVLFGAAHARASFDSPYGGGGNSDTFFAIQPGGGVSIYFNSQVGANIAADYRRIDALSEEAVGEFRVVTGIVVGFGSR